MMKLTCVISVVGIDQQIKICLVHHCIILSKVNTTH